jgi:thioredoxin reductase
MSEKKLPGGAYDVIIIGGGPGGLTAGLYAARASFRTLLVESGMVMSQITVTHSWKNTPACRTSAATSSWRVQERRRVRARDGLCRVSCLEKNEIAGMPRDGGVKTDAGSSRPCP